MTERNSGIPLEQSSATADAIEASICYLPEDLREALLLTRARGLTFAEVASILDVSEATLRQRVDEATYCIGRSLAEHDDLPLAEDALVAAVDAAVRRMTGAPAESPTEPPPRRQQLGDRIRGWLWPRATVRPQPLGWRPTAPWLVPALGTGVAVLLLALALRPLLLPPTADDAVGVPGLEGRRTDLHLPVPVEAAPLEAGTGASSLEQAIWDYGEAVERALNASEAGDWLEFELAVDQANAATERVWDAAAPANIRRPAAVLVKAEPVANDLFELANLISEHGSTAF